MLLSIYLWNKDNSKYNKVVTDLTVNGWEYDGKKVNHWINDNWECLLYDVKVDYIYNMIHQNESILLYCSSKEVSK